jgi:PadR family transcriptional regulator PadR
MLVLRTLAEGEMYGYEISRRIRSSTSEAFVPSEGSLYPVLHRLETEGALDATWHASDRGPSRRYYRMTRKGRGALAKYEREWSTVQMALEVAPSEAG